MAKSKAETDLVGAVLEYLQLRGIPSWRNNTGAANYVDRHGKKRHVKYGVPGASDILGLIPPTGRFLAIECKVGKNKPTDKQIEFLAAVREAGGLDVVAYVLDDVFEALGYDTDLERRLWYTRQRLNTGMLPGKPKP